MPNSFTPSALRRQVVTVEGFTRLAPPSNETTRAIAETRAAYAIARALRFVERRVAPTDRRRGCDRRAMQDVLNEADAKCRDLRFTGELPSMFGAM